MKQHFISDYCVIIGGRTDTPAKRLASKKVPLAKASFDVFFPLLNLLRNIL